MRSYELQIGKAIDIIFCIATSSPYQHLLERCKNQDGILIYPLKKVLFPDGNLANALDSSNHQLNKTHWFLPFLK